MKRYIDPKTGQKILDMEQDKRVQLGGLEKGAVTLSMEPDPHEVQIWQTVYSEGEGFTSIRTYNCPEGMRH